MIVEEPTVDSEPCRSIILPDSTVWTPEIERLAVRVTRWIQLGLPGGAVYGQQLNGKTRACWYLNLALPELLGYPIAILHWAISGQEEKKQNEWEFTQDMAIQSDCDRVSGRDLALLRRRLHKHMFDLASVNGSKRLLIIVDDAQNLSSRQFNYLIHWYKVLEALGIRPFFLIIGQPELLNAHKSWNEINGMQLVGRFFSVEHRYRGIDPSEIKDVLESLDIMDPGEQSFALAKTFPSAYAGGWRLQNLASAFEEAAQILMKEQTIESGLRLPMQYLRSSVLSMLYRAIDENLPVHMLTTAMALTALKDSGFSGVLSYYVDRATKTKDTKTNLDVG
jgi:hypothetical protein